VPHKTTVWHELVNQNINPGDPRKWIEECLSTGHLMCVRNPDGDDCYDWVAGMQIHSSALLSGYREWVRGLRGHGIKGVPNDKFWRCMSDLAVEVDRVNSGNRRALPPRDKCMELLSKLLLKA
jgi:hypothetical protein